jgi:hypothetical protein
MPFTFEIVPCPADAGFEILGYADGVLVFQQEYYPSGSELSGCFPSVEAAQAYLTEAVLPLFAEATND